MEERAPRGGVTLYKRYYKGGEFEPFYVPREVMPQIDEADLPALLDFATTRKVQWTFLKALDPRTIRPHQRIDHDLARSMDPMVLSKPILISIEPFILDGNHRWWEHRDRQLAVDAYRFSLAFEAAIQFLFAFPKTYSFSTMPDPGLIRN